MKFKKIVTAGLLMSMLASGVSAFAEGEEKVKEYSAGYRTLELVAQYAAELYLEEGILPSELMKDGISKMLEDNPEQVIPLLKTMVSTLDPYSEYFTLSEYETYINDVNSSFYGIGVIIQKNGEYVEITGFTQDSPSEKAGMQMGDKIAKVNGTDMRGKNMNEVRSEIMGELGTKVTVTVLRNNEYIDYSITRSLVNQNTVEYTKIDDNTAYIAITDMAQNTVEEFREALRQIDSWGIKNIVLDLRDNGGGYLDSAVELAQMIVPKGLIVKTVYRDNIGNQDFYSNLEKTKYNFNILVNEYTASAAEILASALQESGAGKLIGKQTYGKAVIQKIYKLIDNSILKLTVGRYMTRNGNEINEIGIAPDVKVSNVANPIDTTKYSSFDYKTKLNIGMSGENVRAAKERLYLLGLYNGAVDDNFDDLLEQAVIKFQGDNGLYPYGVLDITTQVKIENTFAQLKVLEDLQYKKALELFGVDVNALE